MYGIIDDSSLSTRSRGFWKPVYRKRFEKLPVTDNTLEAFDDDNIMIKLDDNPVNVGPTNETSQYIAWVKPGTISPGIDNIAKLVSNKFPNKDYYIYHSILSRRFFNEALYYNIIIRNVDQTNVRLIKLTAFTSNFGEYDDNIYDSLVGNIILDFIRVYKSYGLDEKSVSLKNGNISRKVRSMLKKLENIKDETCSYVDIKPHMIMNINNIYKNIDKKYRDNSIIRNNDQVSIDTKIRHLNTCAEKFYSHFFHSSIFNCLYDIWKTALVDDIKNIIKTDRKKYMLNVHDIHQEAFVLILKYLAKVNELDYEFQFNNFYPSKHPFVIFIEEWSDNSSRIYFNSMYIGKNKN